RHLPPDVWRGGDLNALSYCVPPNASCTTPTSIDGESRFSQFPPLEKFGPTKDAHEGDRHPPLWPAGRAQIRERAGPRAARGRNPHPHSCRHRQSRARRDLAGRERARAPVLPLIPGVDCAGVVDALGAGVTRWRPGMRVAAAGVMPLDICREDDDDYAGPTGMMGIKRPGGFAEMVAVPACAAIEL